ncbi:hypothetical protein V1514DRAFT_326278 [Lipomyces japonicus]|uniref:uncharacterized protein n=1 Tax=Lipomyces japonicus TaxID=56871 RepID=UPI0034CDB55B
MFINHGPIVPKEPVFRFQLNYIDSYQATPTSFDQNCNDLGIGNNYNFYRVPVIRIFGTADSGQKVCAHFHGIYPYFFIEYTGHVKDKDSYIEQLSLSINNVLRASYQQSSGAMSYVANIILCKGVPFYGFHVGWRYYLKIYLLDPAVLGRLSELMRQGAVLSRPFQLYEAHLPYLPQFMTDFNLYGCGWINLSNLKFRSPIPAAHHGGILRPFEYNTDTINESQLTSRAVLSRTSHCSLEIDVDASSILNRYDIKERSLHEAFIERVAPVSSDFKFMHSMAELWRDERSRRHKTGRHAVEIPGMNSEQGFDVHSWSNEQNLRLMLDNKIAQDGQRGLIDYESFNPVENPEVPTLFEAVPAMFSKKYSTKWSSFEEYGTKSFWQDIAHVDDEITAVDARIGIHSLSLQENMFPSAQRRLKKRSIVTSSDTENQSDHSTAFSADNVLKMRATRSMSIKDFGQIVKKVERQPVKHAKRVSSQNDDDRTWKRILLSSSSSSTLSPPQSQHVRASQSPENKKLHVSFQSLRSSMPSLLASSSTFDVDLTCGKIKQHFNITSDVYIYKHAPIHARDIFESFDKLGIPRIIYQKAYFSVEADVPKRVREYAGKHVKLESTSTPFLAEFSAGLSGLPGHEHSGDCQFRSWTYSIEPPSVAEVKQWISGQETGGSSSLKGKRFKKFASQIEEPVLTQKAAMSEKKQVLHRAITTMSILSLEVHANTAADLLPNPKNDAITFVTWIFESSTRHEIEEDTTGVIMVSEDPDEVKRAAKIYGSKIELVASELDLLNKLIDIVRENDPDILTGYEVQSSSWGYVIDRAGLEYEYDIREEFARTIIPKRNSGKLDRWGYTHVSTVKITGRHVLNIWRLLKGTVNLLQYSMQNCAFHILRKRIPLYTNSNLTKWQTSGNSCALARAIQYYVIRTQINLELLRNQEIIERTSEQARLLGVDFFSVISRGSQFKVESLMFRIAKAENYMLISPSRRQVGHQNALECLPLVMEPKSSFYTDPVVVLDFQSLYPSLMIAFNFCYSTCLGRIESWQGRNKLGVVDDFIVPDGLLALLKDDITISSNGLVFVKPSIRRSLLAKMLAEILETRVMVKNEMKDLDQTDPLRSLLNNRQLALKLIANVTYGYTSASFSGRMPCAEIADAIVQSGREILERSIDTIEKNEKWNAEVVYGDTDSVFVHLPGRTKEQAFQIGKQIAQTVTGMHPNPIKLKMEKVYLPCFLLTKKRYVGAMFETPEQKIPTFDAKGTETVRRDGTPAEQKIEEKILKILFETADLSAVKTYFQEQCLKIMRGKVSVQDFCFSKQVKLGSYSERGTLPPAAMVSVKKVRDDPRAEPQYGERVSYVVVAGPTESRLIDRCVAPEVLLSNSHMTLDAEYYISKNLIPPLDRFLNLIGASAKLWYDEMPRVIRAANQVDLSRKTTISSYMKSSLCIVCKENRTRDGMAACPTCSSDASRSLFLLRNRNREHELDVSKLLEICHACSKTSLAEDVAACVSQDCPVYYSRVKAISKAGKSADENAVFEQEWGMINDAW